MKPEPTAAPVEEAILVPASADDEEEIPAESPTHDVEDVDEMASPEEV